jgi:hypothetical protein
MVHANKAVDAINFMGLIQTPISRRVRGSVSEKRNAAPNEIHMRVPYMTKILEVLDRDNHVSLLIVKK